VKLKKAWKKRGWSEETNYKRGLYGGRGPRRRGVPGKGGLLYKNLKTLSRERAHLK